MNREDLEIILKSYEKAIEEVLNKKNWTEEDYGYYDYLNKKEKKIRTELKKMLDK